MIRKSNNSKPSTAMGGISLARVQELVNAVKEADLIAYDNSVSGLSAIDVQDAIDELAASPGGTTLHAELTDTATDGHPANIISYSNAQYPIKNATNVQDAIDDFIDYLSWITYIRNRIEQVHITTYDVALTTTGATDLQTAINNLTEGQVLEIQADATYDPISLPTDKGFVIRVKEGYGVKMTGQNCINIQDGCRNIFIQGILFEGCSTSDANARGSAIYLDHEAVATDITFYDCTFSLCTGSAVMLSYHQTLDGDNYATANSYPDEFSTKIAFVRNHFYKSCNNGIEGANLSVRGIQYFYAKNNVIDVADTGGRGIQCQNCIDILVEDNKIQNATAGNGEGIKVDRIGSPSYYNSGHIIRNTVYNAIEGIDIDDYVYGSVNDNICYGNSTEGISVDSDSNAIIIGNITFQNTDGIRLEATATANLKCNVSFQNTSNDYRMDGGQTYDASNTTEPNNAFIIPSNIYFNQTTWDDIRIIPGAFDYAGVADPTLVNYQPGGTGRSYKLYEFANSDIAYATVQIPHSYKEGTDLDCHIHWTPGSNGTTESGNTVAWKVDVSWVNVDGTFPATTTLDCTDTCDGTNDKSQRAVASALLSGTGKKISSQLLIAIYRDTGDTWTGNTTGNLPLLIELDFHFQISTIGSRQETIK